MSHLLRSCPRVGYGARAAARKAVLPLLLSVSPAAAEEVTIAALGDSLTQGYGLEQGQGLVPQLEAWLRDKGAEVTLINAGVSGDTTAGGLSRIDWTLTDDVGALIVALGGNDVLRGIDPAVSRANLDGIMAAADARGLPVLLVGIDAPGNYGPEYERDFEAIYPDLAETYGALVFPDILAPITAALENGKSMAGLMQADGIHPAPEGVALIVEALGPLVLALIDKVE